MMRILLAMIFFLFVNINAQLSDKDFLPNFIPPSPEAYSLGKYGNMEIGEFTGSSNVNISLLKFHSNKLSTEIALSYNSNGLKVDDKESNVGLGWTLIAGGVINRLVRGKDDFEYPEIPSPESFSGGVHNPQAIEFIYKAGNYNVDSEDDIFTFSFGNISGNFILKNGNFILLDKSDLKIETLINTGNEPSFLITDPKGTKFYFEALEKTNTRVSGGGHSLPSPLSITAWYLTKIESSENEVIIFEYDDYTHHFTQSQSQSLTFSEPRYQIQCTNSGDSNNPFLIKPYIKSPTKGVILSNEINIYGKRIKKILSSPLNRKVEFQYNTGNILLTYYENSTIIDEITLNTVKTANGRIFLNSISTLSGSNNHQFEYFQKNNFPPRLSFSQDHWGYYNGKANINIIPKNILHADHLNHLNYNGADKEPDHSKSIFGLLSKVTYPTKGYSTFDYEPHSYFGTRKVLPPERSFSLGMVVKQHELHTSKKDSIYSGMDQVIKMTTYGSFNSMDCPSSYNLGNNKHRLDLRIRNKQTNQLVNISKLNSQGFLEPVGTVVALSGGQANDYYFDALAGQYYQIELFSNWMCTNGSVTFKYYDLPSSFVDENIVVGGHRIKKITDFSGGQTFSRKYYYGQKTSLNQSSGNKGLIPNYKDFRKKETSCSGYIVRDAVITSTSLFPLFDSGKSNIYYQYVTISLGGDNFENGGIEKEFIINRDYWGNQLFGSENVSVAPWTNFGWNNGYLKKEIYFDNLNTIIRSHEHFYKKQHEISNKSYFVRKNYDPLLHHNPTYTCTQEDVLRPDNGYEWQCTASHSHMYLVSNDPDNKCTANGAQNVKFTYLNRCYQKITGTVVTFPFSVENLDVVEYNNFSSQKFLEKTISTEYFNGAPKVTEVVQFYDSANHYQLTSTQNKTSDFSESLTHYAYAHEKNNAFLIDKNMVGIPLETTVETKQDSVSAGKIISQVLTKYPTSQNEADNMTAGLPLPYEVWRKDLQSTTMHKELAYDLYDSVGNLQQYTSRTGVPTAVIWGYNQTQPVAKIEGATYAQVQLLSAGIIAASNIDAGAAPNNDETALLNLLDAFRKDSALSGFQITTYTYDPLIGVRSITPPSGIREYYFYDSANRLEKIVDINGNILKEFKYNYKQ